MLRLLQKKSNAHKTRHNFNSTFSITVIILIKSKNSNACHY